MTRAITAANDDASMWKLRIVVFHISYIARIIVSHCTISMKVYDLYINVSSIQTRFDKRKGYSDNDNGVHRSLATYTANPAKSVSMRAALLIMHA